MIRHPSAATPTCTAAAWSERNGRQVARVAAAIANAPAGAVVVHCVAGADRTGMLVALVLDLIGVDRAAIMADYARTRECLAQSGSSAAPPSAPSNGLRDDGPPTILAALDYLDEHFAGSRNYLLLGGTTIGDMDRLRA